MNQILEFLAENYIYVAGGSAVIIIILLIIIAFGNKKSKKHINKLWKWEYAEWKVSNIDEKL